MANTNAVILPAHYVGIDTDSGNVVYIPDEVKYKKYRLENIGTSGNTATISLTGADNIVLNDGETVEIIYSESSWQDVAKVTSLTVANQALFESGVSFLPGRKILDKNLSSAITASGWYTIARLTQASSNPCGATFRCSFGNGAIEFKVINSSSERNIKVIDYVGATLANTVKSARVTADSDSKGVIVQVQVATNITTLKLLTDIFAYGRDIGLSSPWFELVDPYQDESPVTLPDGTTTTSFLVAGEEYKFSKATVAKGISFGILKISNDLVRLEVDWEELPYPAATAVTITLPSSDFSIRGAGSVYTLDGTYAYTLVDKVGHRVVIAVTKTGAFTTMSASEAYFIRCSDNGTGKIVLS